MSETPHGGRRRVRCLVMVPTESPGWASRLLEGIAQGLRERRSWVVDLLPTCRALPRVDAGPLGYDGILAMPNRDLREVDLAALGCPVVTMGSSRPGIPLVTADEPAIGRMAAHHLARPGWRLSMVSEFPSAWQEGRRQGWQEVLPQAEHVFLPPDVVAMAEYLQERPGPLAIFAVNDHHAALMAQATRRCGRTVGGDVRILGVNDSVETHYGTPPLSSIRVPFEAMGAEAVETLARRLRGLPVPPVRMVGEACLLVRASSAPGSAEHAALQALADHLRHALAAGRRRTVDELLADGPCSRSTAERMIRRHHGQSLRAFVQVLRGHLALELIQRGDLDLDSLGQHLGIGGGRALRRLLREHLGLEADRLATLRRQILLSSGDHAGLPRPPVHPPGGHPVRRGASHPARHH